MLNTRKPRLMKALCCRDWQTRRSEDRNCRAVKRSCQVRRAEGCWHSIWTAGEAERWHRVRWNEADRDEQQQWWRHSCVLSFILMSHFIQ